MLVNQVTFVVVFSRLLSGHGTTVAVVIVVSAEVDVAVVTYLHTTVWK